MIKKHIPNALTSCNLICGCIATLYALQPTPNYQLSLLFIVAGATFDFFDGFAARLLHVSSPIGKELDSLADCITFGFAPAGIVFSLLITSTPVLAASGGSMWKVLPYVAFLMAAFSALRLAKFNLDTRQSDTFIGMPTPANALLWGSLSLGVSEVGVRTPLVAAALVAGVLLACWLLVCEIPMFALKFKHFRWKGNALRYLFILISAVILVLLRASGFAVVVGLYIAISVVCYLRDWFLQLHKR